MRVEVVSTVAANSFTHAGVFHADEIFGTVILGKILEKVRVCRTFKVPENIAEDSIVFDVGGGKYDHHQRGGNGCRENGVPYAAAGLLWKEFGPAVVEDTCNPQMVWECVDRELIQAIDAIDNGVMPKAEYPAQAFTVSHVISGFNPTWDSEENADEAFLKAVAFAEVIFDNTLANAISKAKAQGIVLEAIKKSSNHIMVLEKFVPWQEYLFDSDTEKAEAVQFVIFPSNRGGFNWQCVPDAPGSFGQRKPVPEKWKGLRDKELQELTGVETAIFCHQAGFMGSAATLEDAIKMAKMAVEA